MHALSSRSSIVPLAARSVSKWLCVSLLVSTCVCGNDLKPPPVPTRLQTPDAVSAPGADPQSPNGPPSQAKTLPVNEGWWFADGLGHAAMLARQRHDWDAATTYLDDLLARTDLSPDDRGAASLLRGLVAVERDEFAAAADDFAAARRATALAPIGERLTLLEAQARLDASQPQLAHELVAGLSVRGSLAPTLLIIQADAAQRIDQPAEAIAAYRRFLNQHGDQRRRHEVRAKLATLLLEQPDGIGMDEARQLYERLVVEVPLSDYGEAAYKALLADATKSKRQLAEELRHEHELSTLRALSQFRRHRQLQRQSEAFLKKKRLDDRTRCEAEYLHGSAVFRLRQRADARSVLLKAAESCSKAGWADLEVKSRYQAARGAYAAGEYSKAGEEFENLATSFADHSYADDALILAGESWQDAGQPTAARAAYERSVSQHPGGDMAGEARRRLLLLAFAEGRPDDVVALADAALGNDSLHAIDRAKLSYLRGRALQRLGRDDEASQAFLTTVAIYPLSYPALVALSRLREIGDSALASGFELLDAPVDPSPIGLDLPPSPAASRAHLLARLGMHDAVRDELDDAGIGGWPAVAVLARAGLYPESQRLLANLGSAWRTAPPTGPNRPLWELAHPRPFHDIIAPNEARHGLPSYLTFAVMQTESRFDPAVVSHAGAKGLVQLMPATAEGVAGKAGISLTRNALFDPETNLDLGMRYLSRLLDRAGDPAAAPVLAVPSYNAGAGSVDRWLRERPDWDLDLWVEAIPYDETRGYVQSVLGRWYTYRWLYATDLEPTDRVPYIPLTRASE